MSDENGRGHEVVQVEIAGASVVAVCGCGWKSPSRPTETEARADQDDHALRAK